MREEFVPHETLSRSLAVAALTAYEAAIIHESQALAGKLVSGYYFTNFWKW